MPVFAAIPMLPVSNLDDAQKYYVDVLGFEVDYRYQNHAGLHLGDGFIRLREVGLHDSNSGSAYFICADIEPLYDSLKARKAIIRKELSTAADGNSNFIVRDLDGNELIFASETVAD